MKAHHGDWFKSSYSAQNGDCVEVAWIDEGAAMRDAKQRGASTLAASESAWQAFVGAVKRAEL